MLSVSKLSDQESVGLLSAGDQDAYAEIYKRYFLFLTGFAEAKLYNLEHARDLIHDLFTILWSEWHTIDIHDNLRAYIFAATRYQIINRLTALSFAFHSLDKELNARELEANIRLTLTELPEKTKHIFH